METGDAESQMVHVDGDAEMTSHSESLTVSDESREEGEHEDEDNEDEEEGSVEESNEGDGQGEETNEEEDAKEYDSDDAQSGDEEEGEEEEEEEEEEDDDGFDPCLKTVSKAIQAVEPPGDFYTCGVRPVFPPPAMHVDGVGYVTPPLADSIAKALVDMCHLAPYGHGEKTIVDTQVRNTWELSTSQFKVENPAWQPFVDEIMTSCRVPLGIDASVKVHAKLYKMVLYEAGGKFDKHQDSEKEDGMFGTLVVVLPGRFEGGQLVVHDPQAAGRASESTTINDKPHVWDAGAMDPFAVKFAAFYGDCPHEVHAVTKGYRLCLTYNLINVTEDGVSASPCFGSNHPLYESLKKSLCAYFADKDVHQAKRQRTDEQGTTRHVGFDLTNPATHRVDAFLVYALAHKYTKAGLSWKFLKNKDAKVAQCLAHFCNESQGALRLFMCKLRFDFDWHSREEEAYESDASTDELPDHQDLRKTLLLQKGPWVLHPMDGDAQAACAPAALNMRLEVGVDLNKKLAPVGFFNQRDLVYDGKNEQMFTGNDGSILEKWYTSASLMVMPVTAALQFLCAGNGDFATAVVALWVPLVTANPRAAKHAAVTFFDRNVKNWSLASPQADTILDATGRLGDLQVLQSMVKCCQIIEFQPKLANLVATFDWDAVVVMVAAVSKRTETMGGIKATYEARTCVNLVASVLHGEDDRVKIAKLLETVTVVPRCQGLPCDGDELAWTSQDTTPEEYARVLEAAYKVSVDQLDRLAVTDKAKELALVVAPAVRLLLQNLHADAKGQVRPVVQKIHDALSAAAKELYHLPYTEAPVSCPRKWSSRDPMCPLCTVLDRFFWSETETSLEVDPKISATAHTVEVALDSKTKNILKIDRHQQDGDATAAVVVVVKIFHEHALYRKAREEMEAFSKLVAE